MKREIKFRGKRIDNGEWVEGHYYYDYARTEHVITRGNGWVPTYNNPDEGECNEYFPVDPSTVGQYTGLKDKNGKDGYHGDVFIYMGEKFIFEWHNDWHCWYGKPLNHNEGFASDMNIQSNFEIIGNIHENN